MYYKYSELYKQNSVDKQLKIEYDGGTITNSELYSESFELTESLCSETNLKFGLCEASVLKFKVANVIEPLKGKWLTVTETLAGNESVPFQFGKYKVCSDAPNTDRYYREITAYDGAYDILNADMTEWYNKLSGSSITIRLLRTKFLDYFGFEYENIVLPNDYVNIKITAVESMSGKDLINAICELNGCFGHFGRDGRFQFKILNPLSETQYPDNELYSSNTLYPAEHKETTLQARYFDGNYKIENKYLYFKVHGCFIVKGNDNAEHWYEGNYEMRFSYPTGREFACIQANAGFYKTYEEETYYSPQFSWRLSDGTIETNHNVCPDIDINCDGTFAITGTVYLRASDFPYIAGVPVFEDVAYRYNYLSSGDLIGCINWNGINEISRSECISGNYEDYTVQKIDCVLAKDIENNAVITSGDGDNCYIVEDNFLCNIITDGLQNVIDILYSTIKEISYIPHEVEVIGNPCLEVGDRVKIRSRTKVIESYILKRTLKGIQSLRDTYSADGEEKQSKDVNSIRATITQIKEETATLNENVESLTTQVVESAEIIEQEVTRATEAEEELSSRMDITESNITMEVRRATATEEELSSRIDVTESDITMEVRRATATEEELSSRISITEEGIESSVRKGEIISTINQSAESVTIEAKKINLNGSVTANDNVIIGMDGKITAKEAFVNGKVEATSLKADKSYYIVDSDFEKAVEIIKYVADSTSDTTYQFGRLTGNGYGSGLNYIAFKDESQVRTILFKTANIDFGGADIISNLNLTTFKLNGGESNNELLYCNTEKNTYVGTKTDLAGYTTYLRGTYVRLVGKSGVYLGSSGSTAVSSDENLKDLYELDERYEKFYDLLEPVLYTYKEIGHRKHVGIGARHVKDCLDKAEIDTEDFAGLIIETDVTIGEEESRQHYDDLYSIRYEEFIMLNTMKIKKLEKRVETLENELAEQKKLIQLLMEKEKICD